MSLLQIKKEVKIKCLHCSSLLLNVLATTVHEGEKEYRCRYKIIKCYNCNMDNGYIEIFDGRINILPPSSNFDIEHINTEINKEGIIDCTIKVARTIK